MSAGRVEELILTANSVRMYRNRLPINAEIEKLAGFENCCM
jgi:hypothetical protein